MRKLLLFTLILLFFGINNSFALWYGNTVVSYSTSPIKEPCPQDSDTASAPTGYPNDTAVTNTATSLTPTPTSNTYALNSGQTNASIVSSSGNMYCLKWDGIAPTGVVSYSTGGLNYPTMLAMPWTNQQITVTVTCSDTGGSGCVNSTYTTILISNGNGNITISDVAGNTGSIVYNVTKIDTTAPKLSDITNTIPSNLLANNAYSYSFNIGINGGSPISKILGTITASGSTSSSPSIITISSTGFIWDISKVDNNRISSGLKVYTFTLIKFCDQALNCWTKSSTSKYNKKHNVYANTLSIQQSLSKGGLDVIQIANGTIHKLKITLKDTYGNQIVPASGVSRTIDFNFDVNNTLKLDQYQNNGDAIFLTTPNNSTYTNKLLVTTKFSNQNSSNGIYPFNFKVYAPTYSGSASDGRQYIDGNFKINNITYAVNQNTFSNILFTNIGNSTIDFQFKPIYTTKFSGPIKDFGFIEGATQSGVINISKNGIKNLTPKLYLEFGSGVQAPSLNFDMQLIAPTNTGVLEGNGNKTYIPGITNFNGNNNISTLITQTGVLANLSSSYLSTHIGYTIDGYNIVYNQDILGKSRYSDTATNNTVTQVGLKVLGKTFSDKQTNITVNQQSSNFNILGNISKANLRKDIVKNTYNIIKNITPTNGGNNINDLSATIWNNGDGKKLQNDSILYFGGLNGGNITLDTNGNGLINPTELIGNKTIIVKGGNLYIKSNIVNKTNSDILGIIVLKDINGKGGNIYIDPSVTEIDAIIYADRSVISYDGIKELDGSTPQIVLKNQLYVYGSIFSNNTIGGSRANPVICPYYITGLCNRITAQTYDFNYLRRYFLYTDALSNLVPVNGGKHFYSTTDPNYKYPIIIKYNPIVQISPPPLFYK